MDAEMSMDFAFINAKLFRFKIVQKTGKVVK